MPVFEYKCNKCGYTMEFLEKSPGPGKHFCERCKSPDLKKLLSSFAVGYNSTTKSQNNGFCPTGTCPLS